MIVRNNTLIQLFLIVILKNNIYIYILVMNFILWLIFWGLIIGGFGTLTIDLILGYHWE